MQKFLDPDRLGTQSEPDNGESDDSCPMIDLTIILGSMNDPKPPCSPNKIGIPQGASGPDWKELALSLLDMIEDMGVNVDKMREGNDGAVSTIPAEHQGLQEQGISVESSPRQGLPRKETTERQEAGDQGCYGENGEEENDPRTNSNVKKRPAWKR